MKRSIYSSVSTKLCITTSLITTFIISMIAFLVFLLKSDAGKGNYSWLKETYVLVLIFVAMILFLFIVLWLVIKHMIKPLEDFSNSALEISKGNFDVELPEVNTHDEMAQLHDSFIKMQRSIKKYTKELEESTRKQAFMMGELQVAGRIQDDMLPKKFPPFPERNDIDIRAQLIPAKQIGGDLYNYLIRDNKVYFIIADVSGKSVPAALVMAIANNAFNTISLQTADAATIMYELNITSCANNDNSDYFITALVGILDLKNGNLQLCNAGHNPALMIDAEGKVSLIKIKPNLPLGIVNNFIYSSVNINLTAHTRLVMYTDGITEAEDSDGKFFGAKRLKDCVERLVGYTLTETVENVIREMDLFTNDHEQTDDITIMAVDYNPSDKAMPGVVPIFNDISEIDKVRDFATAISKTMELDDTSAMKLNLALEEAISNIIKYSFKRSSNNIITLFASTQKGKLTIIISDTGGHFDPTLVEDVDTEAPLEKRSIGGLGLTLMRGIASDMKYLRQENHNYLTIVFEFPKV